MTIFYVEDKSGMTQAGEAEGTKEGKEAAIALNGTPSFKIIDVGVNPEDGETIFVTDVPMSGNLLVVLRFADLKFIAPKTSNSL